MQLFIDSRYRKDIENSNEQKIPIEDIYLYQIRT